MEESSRTIRTMWVMTEFVYHVEISRGTFLTLQNTLCFLRTAHENAE